MPEVCYAALNAKPRSLFMPIMLEKLYDALRAANIPDDKARAAAVEVAEFKEAITDIRSTLKLHTWMLSLNTAGIAVILGKLFA
jgi:hypothetical protein